MTQEIVTSHLMDEDTFQEIADRLGWELSRVTSRYRRAIAELRNNDELRRFDLPD